MMSRRLVEFATLCFFGSYIDASLVTLTKTQLKCNPVQKTGLGTCCCTGCPGSTFNLPCQGDIAGNVCGDNQVLGVAASGNGYWGDSKPMDLGDLCYLPGKCSTQKMQYNYMCCDCPASYKVFSTSGNCDQGALCQGCSDPKETLVGSTAKGWDCVIASTTTTPTPTPTPSCTPSGTKCDFYSCLESKKHCGSSGYPTAYGGKYCQLFEQDRSKFTAAGQAWITKTKLCLQQALVADLNNPAATCDKIKTDAFNSHPDCYVQSGLCSLPLRDWKALFGVIEWKDMFTTIPAIKQEILTLEACATLCSSVPGCSS